MTERVRGIDNLLHKIRKVLAHSIYCFPLRIDICWYYGNFVKARVTGFGKTKVLT